MNIVRRQFLRDMSLATGGFLLGFPTVRSFAENGQSDLVMVDKGTPEALVRKAVELMGGMSRFVKPGQTVVLKPNISWDRTPELAATTNPQLCAEVVKMCLEAGAKKVVTFDNTCNEARRCYKNSGIEKAMDDAGASVRHIHEKLFDSVAIPDAFTLKEWDFYRDAIDADVLINMPCLKHHGLSRLSLGLKNMMGLIGGNRGKIHTSFPQKIADINRVLKPQLTILDAIRVLRSNGPQGGSPGDVEKMDTVIAGIDPVLVDTWGAKFFGENPKKLGWLTWAEKAGLGTTDSDTYQPLRYTLMKTADM